MQLEIGSHTYTLTFKPQKEKLKESLNAQDYKHYLDLYTKAAENSKEALPSLLQLHAKYPNVAPVTSLLTYVYLKLKKLKKAEQLIETNYRTNPDDIFARVNYADQCLRNKQFDQIPAIFNQTFELSELYPHKRVYHYSEMGGFTRFLSRYYYNLKDRKQALEYYRLAVIADPRDPGLKPLEKLLFKKVKFKRVQSYLHKISEAVKIPIPF